MRTMWTIWALLVSAAMTAGISPARASDTSEFPHIKDLKKCPRCKADFDGTPHPLDYRQCPKCQVALDRAMAYVKKNFKPSMFGLILDTFYGGFVFMMDRNNTYDKELALCAKNCRDLIKPAPDGNFASPTVVGESWCSWKKSMAMFFLTEYSLRYGLTPENKAALIDGAKFATETATKGGGWFHGKPSESQYAPDIAIIGTIYYAAFLEMKTLGIDPGPVLDETRTYLESISDGKTIGYSKGWKGGMGGGGADGFITLGLLGSGRADDKWAAGLAGWMKQNYMDAPHGHANGELHYFGLGAALHRLGPEHYAKFATCHLHRLAELQREDGGIPALSHDIASETEFLEKTKNDPAKTSSFPATAVFACLLLMERPGAFSPLPAKPAGSIANKDAFKIGSEALEKYEYAKAFKAFAQVLPGGENGELIPQAREQMRAIEAVAQKNFEALQAKEAETNKRLESKANTKEEIVALAEMIKEYEKFAKDFEGTAVAQDARRQAEPIQKNLSAKRQRMVFAMPASAAAATSGGAAGASGAAAKLSDSVQKEWDDKLKSRARAVIASGGKPRCDFKKLSTRLALNSVSENDAMKVTLQGGGQMDMSWSQLMPADKKSLALDLAKAPATPLDHALAAFYLLRDNQAEKAEEQLSQAGPEAAKVRAAFEVQ